MANGIKKIVDYNDDLAFRLKRRDARCTFNEPCYPEFHIGDRRNADDYDYIRFTWDDDIDTTEHHTNLHKWALFYKPHMHQIITLEDGTEWEITTQNKDANIEKIREYINNGYESRSEMSRAARLLDDDMMYEI